MKSIESSMMNGREKKRYYGNEGGGKMERGEGGEVAQHDHEGIQAFMNLLQ